MERARPGKSFGVRGAGCLHVAYGLSILRRASRERRRLSDGEPNAQHTQGNVSVNATTTIRRSREEVYAFWRDFSNMPRFMRHIARVTETNGHTTWEAQASFGPSVSWDAQIISDQPGEEILWRSTEQSMLSNHGAVYFRNAPGGRGTEIHVHIGFEPPLGAVGHGLAKLFRALPREQLNADLRRLKQLLELGEIVQSDASIHRGTHPAQPSAQHLSRTMKALCWNGKKDHRRNGPDPRILNASDAIVKVTSTRICGSDLHLYNGFIPTLEKGDVLGPSSWARWWKWARPSPSSR